MSVYRSSCLDGENRIAGPKGWATKRFDGRYRIRIQVNCSRRAVFRFGQFNSSTVEVNLGPGARVLLSEAHPGMDAHHEFSQMLRESLGDDIVQFVVFVATEETQPAASFLALAHESRGINAHLPIPYAFPVAEGDECFVAIGRCCCVAVFTKPPLQFLRRHLCCVAERDPRER